MHKPWLTFEIWLEAIVSFLLLTMVIAGISFAAAGVILMLTQPHISDLYYFGQLSVFIGVFAAIISFFVFRLVDRFFKKRYLIYLKVVWNW